MANTVAQLRTDLTSVLTTLDAASNIGLVHSYERWALHWEKVLEVLRDPTDGVIRSWMVGYRGYTPEPFPVSVTTQTYAQNKSLTVRNHSWLVRGILALDDANASETTFATAVENVCNAFDSNETLHDSDRYWGHPPMPPVEATVDTRILAGVLCHVAEISMVIGAVHVGGS